MAWQPSPSPTVERKRLELDGPQEAGRVTSVVRYLPGSDFNVHEHPDGEEILVLDGVFTDASGDFPQGTFILNPQGFSHAPSSKDGCLLLVKLRQFPGLKRRQVRVNTYEEAAWRPLEGQEGVHVCELYRRDAAAETDAPGEPESMDLLRMAAGATLQMPPQPNGVELFVVAGAVARNAAEEAEGAEAAEGAKEDDLSLSEGDWVKMPSTKQLLRLTAKTPTTVYLKQNHLAVAAAL